MRCVNCGTEFADGSAQCPVCGAAAYIQQPYGGQYQQNVQQQYGGQYQQNMQQPYGGQYQQNVQQPYGGQYQQNVQQQYGGQYQQNMQQPYGGQYQQNAQQPYGVQYQQSAGTQREKAAPKMGWYKFTINFQLIFGSIFSLIFGLIYITGTLYGLNREKMYNFYSAMRVFDVFIGLLFFILAVFAVYTRIRLKQFKINGPLCLHILNGLGILLIILLKVVPASIIAGSPVITFDLMYICSYLLPLIIYVFADIEYFQKRKHMFVN